MTSKIISIHLLKKREEFLISPPIHKTPEIHRPFKAQNNFKSAFYLQAIVKRVKNITIKQFSKKRLNNLTLATIYTRKVQIGSLHFVGPKTFHKKFFGMPLATITPIYILIKSKSRDQLSYVIVINLLFFQILVIICVNLALKMHSPLRNLSSNQILAIVNNKFNIKQFREIESDILKLFNFDLYFPILLDKVYLNGQEQQYLTKALFIYQLLFFDSYMPAFCELTLQSVHTLAKQPQKANDLKQQIIKLGIKSKNFEIVKQKYQSKFDVDNFLQIIWKQPQY